MHNLCASFVFQSTSKGQGHGARMQLVAKGGPQDLPNLGLVYATQCRPQHKYLRIK